MRFGRPVTASVASAALAVVVAHAMACGQFGVTTDATTDAAAPSTDATGDASGAGEAGADADASADDGGCRHLFCGDFEGASAAQGWEGPKNTPGATVSLAAGNGQPGNALLSSIPAIPLGASAAASYAYLDKPFPGEHALHAEVLMNVATTPLHSSTVLTLFQLSGTGTTTEAGVGVQLREASPNLSVYVTDGSMGGAEQLTVDLPRGIWTKVALDIHFGSPASMALSVDNAQVWTRALVTSVPSEPQVRVGVQHYSGTTPAVSALFDTVRVDRL